MIYRNENIRRLCFLVYFDRFSRNCKPDRHHNIINVSFFSSILLYASDDICCRGNHILPQCIMNGPSPASHLDACEQFFYIYIYIRVSRKLFSHLRERRWHTPLTVFTSDGDALFLGGGVNVTVYIEWCVGVIKCVKKIV